jgi:hypothetical protein
VKDAPAQKKDAKDKKRRSTAVAASLGNLNVDRVCEVAMALPAYLFI